MRTDQEIVDQTEELALNFMHYFYDEVPIGSVEPSTFRDSEDTRAQRCWSAACFAQELLTQTDVSNAVARLEDDLAVAMNDAIDMIDRLSEGLIIQEESWEAQQVTAKLKKALKQYLQEN